MRVRANSEYWTGCQCELLAQEYEIQSVQMHHDFNPDSTIVGDNDVGIIVIKSQWKGHYDKKTLRFKLEILSDPPVSRIS